MSLNVQCSSVFWEGLLREGHRKGINVCLQRWIDGRLREPILSVAGSYSWKFWRNWQGLIGSAGSKLLKIRQLLNMIFRVLDPDAWSEYFSMIGRNGRPASSSLLPPFKDSNCVKLLLLSERINCDCPGWTSTDDGNRLDRSHNVKVSTS